MKKLLTILLVFVICISCVACSTNNTNNSTPPVSTPSSCTHIYSSATCTSPQKCTECGTTKGSALGHNYKAATCTAPKTCTRCNVTTGSSLGHSYSSATCTKPKTCTRCDITFGDKLDHNWNSGVVTKHPDCGNSGSTTYTCAECAKTKTESIPATGHHNWNSGLITKQSTCSQNGIKTYTCSTCLITRTELIEKLSHTYNEAECICGEIDPSYVINSIVPEGGLYVSENGTVYNPGDKMPVFTRDVGDFFFGDYKYTHYDSLNGWVVSLNTDRNKTEYGKILFEINDISVVDIYGLFKNCTKLIQAPIIPNTVTDIGEAFWNCYNLSVTPKLPSKVSDMNRTFQNCTSLIIPPILPESLTGTWGMFYGCSSLQSFPVIPKSVDNLPYAFYNCSNVSGEIEIMGNITVYTNCFYGTKKQIKIIGACHEVLKKQLASTANNDNVTY